MATISVAGVGVRFFFDRQGRPVTPGLARVRRRCTSSWGVRDLELSVASGESVGLIGTNGAGKTTLLRLLAGVLSPDEGSLNVEGRIGSLLATGAGVLPRLTGRENATLLGVLAGLTRVDARRSLSAVRERCGLGIAFDRPVSTYSQGMRARLCFAVMEQTKPEILLLDEVHEALDAEFRSVLEAATSRITGEGGIVIAAGHDVLELERLCDRGVLLDGGRIRADRPLADLLGPSTSDVPAGDPS
jgi:ABC-type polysaccharide/polyol phosphate transport system ATPase subunit